MSRSNRSLCSRRNRSLCSRSNRSLCSTSNRSLCSKSNRSLCSKSNRSLCSRSNISQCSRSNTSLCSRSNRERAKTRNCSNTHTRIHSDYTTLKTSLLQKSDMPAFQVPSFASETDALGSSAPKVAAAKLSAPMPEPTLAAHPDTSVLAKLRQKAKVRHQFATGRGFVSSWHAG